LRRPSSRRPACGYALIALAFLIASAAIVGCGSSDGGGETATQAGRAERAAKRKRERLESELRQGEFRDAQRKERERETAGKARATPIENSTDANSFDQLAGELGGQVGATIGPPGSGSVLSVGNLATGSAWSTSKVPISLRVLEDAGGPSGLSPAQSDEMRRAITLSDNEAAAALFGGLESGHGGIEGASAAVTEVLREAGDSTTQVSTQGRGEFSSYGQTEWSLVNQHQFMSQLAGRCIGSPESDEYVLGLMGEVSSDTWGLGSAGVPALWKGGWGPGIDGAYLVRQMGVLFVGDSGTVVTLAAIPSDGQFETGQRMATAIAQWLAKRASQYAGTPGDCSG
jgi:hypothetical protein